MKILILEDNPDRTYAFCMMFVGHEVVVTPDTNIFVREAERQKWDILFLDHDLGNSSTGYDVVAPLKKSINAKTRVIIHSLNPVGAERIWKDLVHAQWKPFGTFNETVLTQR